MGGGSFGRGGSFGSHTFSGGGAQVFSGGVGHTFSGGGGGQGSFANFRSGPNTFSPGLQSQGGMGGRTFEPRVDHSGSFSPQSHAFSGTGTGPLTGNSLRSTHHFEAPGGSTGFAWNSTGAGHTEGSWSGRSGNTVNQTFRPQGGLGSANGAWQGHQAWNGNSEGQQFNHQGAGEALSHTGHDGSGPAWGDHQAWWRDGDDRRGDRDDFRGHHHGLGFRDDDDDFVFVSFGFPFFYPWYDYYYPYWYYPYWYYPYGPDYYYGGDGYGTTYPQPYPRTQPYAGASNQDLLAVGSQYFAQGDYLQARDTFRRAVVAQPKNPNARFAYGQALFALGQYQSAAEAIRQGLALDQTWPGVEMDLRNAYGDPSEFARQLGQLETYLAGHPDDATARFLLAYNLYFTGQKDRAREEFTKLAEANPLDKAPELFLNYLPGTSGPATTTGPVAPSTPAPQAGAQGY
jgi:hypothetical protein